MNSQKMYIGIDISKLKHDVAAVDENKNLLIKPFVIRDCCEGYHILIERLNQTAHKLQVNNIYIGMEATADYWKNIYYFLKKQPQGYSVTVINPVRTRAYAKTELRRAKTDPVNARDIACFMAEKKPKATVDRLIELENLRDIDKRIHQLKKQTTMLVNKLRLELGKVAPEIEKAISSFSGQQILALLAMFPTAEALDKASFDQLLQLRYGAHQRSLSKTFIQKIKTLAHDSIAYKTGPGSECVTQSLVKSIIDNRNEIARLKQKILDIFKTISASESVLTSIPGITIQTAVLLQAHIGDVNRFSSSKQLVAYFGLNPIVDTSGKSKRKSFLQKRGEPIVRHKLFMVMISMINAKIHPFYPYYRRMVDSGKPKLVAICAAMRKLLTIIYAMLKNNETFNLKKT